MSDSFAADVAAGAWYGAAGYALGRALDAAAARLAPGRARFWVQLLLNALALAALARAVPAFADSTQSSVMALGFPALLFGAQAALYPAAAAAPPARYPK